MQDITLYNTLEKFIVRTPSRSISCETALSSANIKVIISQTIVSNGVNLEMTTNIS